MGFGHRGTGAWLMALTCCSLGWLWPAYQRQSLFTSVCGVDGWRAPIGAELARNPSNSLLDKSLVCIEATPACSRQKSSLKGLSKTPFYSFSKCTASNQELSSWAQCYFLSSSLPLQPNPKSALMNIENSLVISWTKANGLKSLRTAGLLRKWNTPLAILSLR